MAKTLVKKEGNVKQKVLNQLAWDSRIDASRITVEINNNTAVLSGTVSTYADRRFAGIDALLVPGIRLIENRLVISYPLAETPSDADIRANIIAAFSLNASLDASKLNVSVENGIVTLEGTVDLYWQKIRAEEIAADIIGVSGINNAINVIPPNAVEDEAVFEDIVGAFSRNISADIETVRVKVANGIVTLSGTVPDWVMYHGAEEIALNTRGVRSVRNTLVVK